MHTLFTAVLNGIKGLLGGKAAAQFGKGNDAVTGSVGEKANAIFANQITNSFNGPGREALPKRRKAMKTRAQRDVVKHLEQLRDAAPSTGSPLIYNWAANEVAPFIKAALGEEEAAQFTDILWKDLDGNAPVAYLRGLILRLKG